MYKNNLEPMCSPSMDRVRLRMIEPEYHEALQGCLEGRFTEELRVLYQMPFREHVPWDLFPNWARPTDPVEGGHEGGSI